MVEKVAELEANMKFGDELISVNRFGQKILERVGDVVRQGDYEYKYTDNTGIQKKLMQNQTLIQILTPVWNDVSVPLNKSEIVKDALNNAGFENTDKYFINQNPAGMMSTLGKNNIPDNMSGILKNNF